MLVARTCQLYPNAAAATIVLKFFLIFSRWEWPGPVLLKRMEDPKLGFQVWDPRVCVGDRYHQMPIITPAYPQQNSTFNVSTSTKRIIQTEIERGLQVIREIMMGTATWEKLFEEPTFFNNYRHYLVVLVSSRKPEHQLGWCGLVESKLRFLVGNLERNEYIDLAHVNPKRFERNSKQNGEFCSMWFIGIDFKELKPLNIDLTKDIQDFTNLVHKHANIIRLHKEGMEIKVQYLRRNQLNTHLDKDFLKGEKKRMLANAPKMMSPSNSASSDASNASSKRSLPTDTTAQIIKRQKIL